ncbi:MAG: AAA family ATPase [Bacilli bacterium]|nr:AAA family ATPase [Bacilli bacterium]
MKILFVVGPHASGKTYSTKKHIKENNLKSQVTVIDTGPIMREIHQREASHMTIDEWVKLLEQQYGKIITSKIITDEVSKRIEQSGKDNAVIIGYRTVDSIVHLIREINIEDYKILYIDAPISLLYENYCMREGNKKNFKEFEYYINDEERKGLIRLKDYSLRGYDDFQYIYKKSNEDSFEDVIVDYFNTKKENQIKTRRILEMKLK